MCDSVHQANSERTSFFVCVCVVLAFLSSPRRVSSYRIAAYAVRGIVRRQRLKLNKYTHTHVSNSVSIVLVSKCVHTHTR